MVTRLAHDSCPPSTRRDHHRQSHPGNELASLDSDLISLHLHEVHLPLEHDGLMELLTVLACSISPPCHCAFIPLKRRDDGLDRTALGQSCHHDHNEFARLTKSFSHRSSARPKGFVTHPTARAIWMATINTTIAHSDLASCGTRQVRAQLLRRVHRLWCTVLQTHLLPRCVAFFNPPPLFHWLVGLYRTFFK
jgi:hypothetical protein